MRCRPLEALGRSANGANEKNETGPAPLPGGRGRFLAGLKEVAENEHGSDGANGGEDKRWKKAHAGIEAKTEYR